MADEVDTTEDAPNGEYPKMLYRKGSTIEHEGHGLDTITVEGKAEESAARKEGFAELSKTVGKHKAAAE